MQKTVLIALAVIGTLTAGYFLMKSHKTESTSDLKDVYNQWKVNYKINVGAAEDDYRFGVFSSNYALIQNNNKLLGRSFTLGLNAFTHLTQEEFSATHLGLKNVRLSTNTNATTLKSKGSADYRSKMNGVKDQGQCGSCWAFSTVGAIEGLHSVVKGNLFNLAEQELVDCSSSYGNMGCNGGLMDYGFQYVIDNKGLSSEKDYPYTAVDGNCASSGKTKSGAIKSFTDVTVGSAEALKLALDTQPVSVAIEADTYTFQMYKSGVITGSACGTQLDHGVVAVGYNTADKKETSPYYIVRNSWGSSWGNAGHVYIGIEDGNGVCGIQMAASYPSA